MFLIQNLFLVLTIAAFYDKMGKKLKEQRYIQQ